MTMLEPNVQTVVVSGERFVFLPETEYLRLLGEAPEPAMPPTDERGDYPAVEAARVILARKLIRSRRALGWSQAELARRAGVRVETLNRLEQGKHRASVATVDKLDRALREGEAAAGGAKPAGPRGGRKRK